MMKERLVWLNSVPNVRLFVVIVLALGGMVLASTPASAVVPTPPYIQSIIYGGSGCPQGTVGQSLSDDRTTFTLIFDSFVASSGPGVPNSEATKTCVPSLNLLVPTSPTCIRVTWRGFLQLPDGVKGHLQTKQGDGGPPPFVGPTSRDYTVSDTVLVPGQPGGPGGAPVVVPIYSGITLTPPSTSQAAQMTVDSIDGKLAPC
jgi:hypothetical protein